MLLGCIILSLCCTFVRLSTQAEMVCGESLHEARIFCYAPPGTYVTTVRRANDQLGSTDCTYSLHSGSDTFYMDEKTGRLTTAVVIHTDIGHVYSLLVMVTSGAGGTAQPCYLTVRVTYQNLHPPEFHQSAYRTDLLRRHRHILGSTILTVNATDLSPETYNSEIYYFLRELTVEEHAHITITSTPSISSVEVDEWMFSQLHSVSNVDELSSQFLGINRNTGEIYLKQHLYENIGRITVAVLAVDGGSPPLRSTSTVEVVVKVIGAPWNVTVDNVTQTGATACWFPSPIGQVNGFTVKLQTLMDRRIENQSSVDAQVPQHPTCVHLVDLEPATKYELWVCGYYDDDNGMESDKVLFTTLTPVLCASDYCQNGATCSDMDNSTCICPNKWKDVDCGARCTCLNGGQCVGPAGNMRCECAPDFRGYDCQLTNFCPAERINSNKGILSFAKTRSNTLVELPCPYGPPDVKASRRCTVEDHAKNSTWVNFNDSSCNNFEQFEKLFNTSFNDSSIANQCFSIVSNLMDTNEPNDMASYRLIEMVDKFVSNCNFDEPANITTRNMYVEVVKVSIDEEPNGEINWTDVTFTGLTSKQLFLNGSLEHQVQPSMAASSSLDDRPTLTICAQAFSSCARDQNTTDIRLSFVAHRSATLFRERDSHGNLLNDSFLDQPVFTVSIANYEVVNLTNVVNYKVKKPKPGVWYCVYWEVESSRWCKAGMVSRQDDHTITCFSNHMTSFSILFDPTPDDVDPPVAMSIISYVGSGLSVLGLLLTILTFILFRFLNRERSGKILMNLCVSMLLLNVSFLSGAFKSDTLKKTGQVIQQSPLTCSGTAVSPSQRDPVCTAVAVFTHYFLLTTLSWMTVEAINMYQLLIYVFASIESRFLLKRCLLAWGAPAVIVGVTVAVDYGYYNPTNQYCMLSATSDYVYYLTLFGPCCILLLVNFVVFVMVTRVLFQSRLASGRIHYKGRPEDGVTWAQVRRAFTVMTLLGVTWVFGAFAVSGPVREVFQYVFSVLNSLQGFLLFFDRCVQYPDTRSAWLRLFRTGTLKVHRRRSARVAPVNNVRMKLELHVTSPSETPSTNSVHQLIE